MRSPCTQPIACCRLAFSVVHLGKFDGTHATMARMQHRAPKAIARRGRRMSEPHTHAAARPVTPRTCTRRGRRMPEPSVCTRRRAPSRPDHARAPPERPASLLHGEAAHVSSARSTIK
jgi:hypothetical protein